MHTEEKEQIIEGWPYPWPEMLGIFKSSRDEALKRAESEDEKRQILVDYEQKVDRMFRDIPPRTVT